MMIDQTLFILHKLHQFKKFIDYQIKY